MVELCLKFCTNPLIVKDQPLPIVGGQLGYPLFLLPLGLQLEKAHHCSSHSDGILEWLSDKRIQAGNLYSQHSDIHPLHHGQGFLIQFILIQFPRDNIPDEYPREFLTQAHSHYGRVRRMQLNGFRWIDDHEIVQRSVQALFHHNSGSTPV